jgi:hypothetical protein
MVTFCKSLHIAGSSRATYGGHHRIFLEFCETFGIDPLFLSEFELAMAVLHFAMGHTVKSVPPYLSALQYLYDEVGAGPLPRGPFFISFLRGLNRLLSASDEVVRTRAITIEDLATIVRSLDTKSPVEVALATQITLAFFLCLRTEDHTGGRLRWGDIYPQADGSVEFLLPPGKSVRHYRRVAVAARSDGLDVLTWLRRLAAVVPPEHRRAHSPVFVEFGASPDGRQHYPPVSRGAFIARLKLAVQRVLGYSPALYAGYSLRRGGVTAMLSAGAPVPAIKRHVGWQPMSEAIGLYYDHSGRYQMRLPTRSLPLQD